MKNEQREIALRTAVLEWQKKYGIQDGDPLLASLELFQIYLGSLQSAAHGNGSYFPSFEEFRDSVELLDARSKTFSKQAAELTEALGDAPNIKRQLRSYHAFAFVLTALGALAAGVLIGRFLL
jgi:hypothetical protein